MAGRSVPLKGATEHGKFGRDTLRREMDGRGRSRTTRAYWYLHEYPLVGAARIIGRYNSEREAEKAMLALPVRAAHYLILTDTSETCRQQRAHDRRQSEAVAA